MKYKYLMYLLLAVLLGACSDDEPETPVGDSPSKARFEQMAENRTWSLKDFTFVDSQGHVMSPEEVAIAGGPIAEFTGLEFKGGRVTLAAPGYFSAISAARYTWNYEYDEASGKLLLYKYEQGEKKGVSYYIESVDENELVVRERPGILPENYYAYLASQDMELLTSKNDEGSYVRAVYVPLDADAAKAFWEKYPDGDK